MAQTKLTAKVEEAMPIAHELAKRQREISIAEFFEKNRHLLGFDNKRKALLTTIKEAVDNSLDACEEAGILPEISVEIIDLQNERFRVIVEDNGPGIVKANIPKVFAKLLYGSKFHKLSQSRGQQGIGISASVLYAQLTTGKPAKIISRISKNDDPHYYELLIDTKNNAPNIVKEEIKSWKKEHGTRVEIDLEGIYQKGPQSVDAYIKQTAITNPHATIIYTTPKAEQFVFARAINTVPKKAVEIKPHPHGLELGRLIKMLSGSESRTLQAFLTNEFSRVGPGTAKEIIQKAGLLPTNKPDEVSRDQAERMLKAIQETKIISPPTDCIVPIGEEDLKSGLKKEVNAEFYCAVSRPPEVYRGNPFAIEAAIAYGGELPADESVRIMRYANRVPLLYQQAACATTDAVIDISTWKSYGLSQSKGALPVGPAVIVIHMASVWVPFTSEAKEAIAHYPEIIKEIKLALMECGRKLSIYINKKRQVADQQNRVNIFENYIPEVAGSLSRLTGESKQKIIDELRKQLSKNKEFIAQHSGQSEINQKDSESQVMPNDEDEG